MHVTIAVLNDYNAMLQLAQGLFLCGRDLGTFGLMGDIQGAWAAANSVLGYTAHELILGRNITSDLENIPVRY